MHSLSAVKRTLLVVAVIGLAACSSSSPAAQTTTAVVAVSTTQPIGEMLMSACLSHMTRAQVRDVLEQAGKTANQIANDLNAFDGLVATGRC